jgi:hypothetical protein
VYINQAVDLVTATFDPVTKNLGYQKQNVFPQKQAQMVPYNTNQDEIIIDWTLTK